MQENVLSQQIKSIALDFAIVDATNPPIDSP